MYEKSDYQDEPLNKAMVSDPVKELACSMTDLLFSKSQNIIFLRKVVNEVSRNLMIEGEKLLKQKFSESDQIHEQISELKSCLENLKDSIR